MRRDLILSVYEFNSFSTYNRLLRIQYVSNELSSYNFKGFSKTSRFWEIQNSNLYSKK